MIKYKSCHGSIVAKPVAVMCAHRTEPNCFANAITDTFHEKPLGLACHSSQLQKLF